MTIASIKDFSEYWWKEVFNRIIGAMVYIDDCTAECLHWDGGLFAMLNGGAVLVKGLDSTQYINDDHRKAVFITQATSNDLKVVGEIIQKSDLTHCILITTVSLELLYGELNEDADDVTDVIASGKAPVKATKQLEAMLLGWMKKKQCIVEVVYIPIFAVSPTNNLFFTPPYSKLYPNFCMNLIPDAKPLDMYAIDQKERMLMRRFASSFNSMLESMNIKEDIYYMGAFSNLVAGVLVNSPVCVARRKKCSKPVSIIFVDRTLDLVGPTSHSSESVLDKITCALPKLQRHSIDVAINMSAICEANVINHPLDEQLPPGCLFHVTDDSCLEIYDNMIYKSQKEVMFNLYNKLSKIDVQRSPSPKNLVKVTPQSVEKIVVGCKGNYDLIRKHSGILQMALGVLQMLKSPTRSQMDLLMGLERQVLENLSASRDSTSVLNQIRHLIINRKERNITLEDLLALLVHVYSLRGTEMSFNMKHERTLAEALGVALFQDLYMMFSNDEAGEFTAPESYGIAKNMIKRFRDISQMRRILQRYGSVIKPNATGSGHEYRGVVQQLVDDLVDSKQPEIPDIRHRNEGFKDLLMAGLSIITNKKNKIKHPLENPTVIVFIVGGTTAEECKQLHQRVITSGVDNNFIFGSTKLVSPVDAMHDALMLHDENEKVSHTACFKNAPTKISA